MGKLKDARDLVSYLEDQRQPWDEEGKLITKYLVPNKGRWWQGKDSLPYRGSRPGGVVLDSKGRRSHNILKAGMQGGLTPRWSQWFDIRLAEREMMEWKPARMWLDAIVQRINWALHKSNFYPAQHSLYGELSAFGSGNVYTEAHPERILHFQPQTFGEFAWGADQFGDINTNVRRFHMTAINLAAKFGQDRLTEKTRKVLDKTPYEFVEVVQLIKPREDRKPGYIDYLNKPYASIWYEECAKDTDPLLWEGGYDTFPIMASRWDVTAAEIYGDGPAIATLPDIKMLQELVRAQLMGIQKSINPPMRVPPNFAKRVSHIPGGQTESTSRDKDALAPLYQVRPDIGAITAKIDDVRRAISEGFFNDLFQMFSLSSRGEEGVITATEVLERQQEKMTILGPVIERLQTDSLEPAIKRTFSELDRRGFIPPPPEEIAGMELKIEFVSTLARAQKMQGSQSMLSLLTLVGQAAAGDPQVVDKIDWDQVVDEYAIMTGAPAKIIRSDREVEMLRRARAQQIAQEKAEAAALEAAKVVPGAAKDLSETSVQGQAALDRLLGVAQ